jgi:hypothetical protein
MKKIILIIISLNLILSSKVIATDYMLMWEPGYGSNVWALMKVNQSDGSEVTLTSIQLDQWISKDNLQCDTYNGKCYIHQGDHRSPLNVYDLKTDSWSVAKKSSNYTYGIQEYPHFGKDLIRKESDGSVHIGENSLVTQEVGGVQQLYATDSSSNQIDINIKSGTNLLINGVNVQTSISANTSNISSNVTGILANTNLINSESQKLSNRIEASTALSSALASLPSSSPDAAYTCGIGTGLHNSNSALAAGCAADFANFAFVDNLPKIFERASFNIGSSFLMNGEPDLSEARDTSIKAGITFKFGSPKKIKVADITQLRTENKIDAVMLQNKKVMDENATLKKQLANNSEKNQLLEDQIAAINLKLETLNMVASN